jgi:uncharacterized membrane protein YjdF
MHHTKHEWLLVTFTFAYIVGFSFVYLGHRNFEFLWYVAVLLFFFFLIALTLRRSNFPLPLLWGLSVWGLLHLAGGGIVVGSDVLYGLTLIPLVENGEFTILRYDQAVHFFGFAVATFVVAHLLFRYLTPHANRAVICSILVAAGTGLGVLNEIVEFSAVLLFSETGVGGYYNTSLDLVFNTAGASVAALFLARHRALRSAPRS